MKESHAGCLVHLKINLVSSISYLHRLLRLHSQKVLICHPLEIAYDLCLWKSFPISKPKTYPPKTFSIEKLFKSKDTVILIISWQIYDRFNTNTETLKLSHSMLFKLLSRTFFVYKQRRQLKLLKSMLPFKKIANFTGNLLQNYI